MMSTMLRPFAVLLATASLAACATPIPGADENAKTSAERFKVKVEEQPEEIRLAMHAQGLSGAQQSALAEFQDNWREGEGRLILIQAPSGAKDPGTAYRMMEGARAFLLDHGVPEEKIDVIGYDPAGDAAAPLIVGYMRYSAVIPECGKNWPNLARSIKNQSNPNFGCATNANMAVQMADQGDLVHPRTMTPQDAARRQAVLDKYRAGEKTGAEKDESANGAVSTAVK